MIFSTRYCKGLAAEVAKQLNTPVGAAEIKNFPSGELYVRVLENRLEESVVLGNTHTASDILELVFLCDAVASFGKKFTLAVPYFGYARQNKRFEGGEALSAHAMVSILQHYHPKKFLAVDLHAPLEGVENISALKPFAEYFKDKNVAVISPDKGGGERAIDLAKALNAQHYILEKKRVEKKVATLQGEADVQGKDVVLLDDMIDTGSTILKAVEHLRSLRAGKIFVAATHLILSNNAGDKLRQLGVEVVGGDTLEHVFKKVSVADSIAEALRKKQ